LKYLQDIQHYKLMKFKADTTGDLNLAQQAQDFLDFVAAPMREERCYQYGEANRCPFYGICFNEGGLEHVMEDGEFERREPHHATELEEAE
jgi:hypothetical protein